MIGHIESYSQDIQTGVIKSDKQFYEFHIDTWESEAKPIAGDDVEFHLDNNNVFKVSLIGDYVKGMQPVKSRKIAGILGITLGAIGLHRIYLGFYGTALVQIIVTFLSGGFGLLWGFIEGILILGAHMDKDAKGRRLK